MTISVHDTLSMNGHLWSVTGIFLGSDGAESVIGLQVIGERFDASAYGKTLPELFVPEIILRRAFDFGLLTVISEPAQ